jgi:hypothetical protein
MFQEVNKVLPYFRTNMQIKNKKRTQYILMQRLLASKISLFSSLKGKTEKSIFIEFFLPIMI